MGCPWKGWHRESLSASVPRKLLACALLAWQKVWLPYLPQTLSPPHVWDALCASLGLNLSSWLVKSFHGAYQVREQQCLVPPSLEERMVTSDAFSLRGYAFDWFVLLGG